MAESTDDDRWRQALGRFGPEIVRAKHETGSEHLSGEAVGDFASPEPLADPALHPQPTLDDDRENSPARSLGYWAAIASIAGAIAAGTGLLALLPMAMR
jgi:hypothetical protein